MKIIKTITLSKYRNEKKYEHCDGNIYKDKTGGIAGSIGGVITPVYCVTLRTELEDDEDTQYPLEDILDKYCVNCTDVMNEMVEGNKRIFVFEIEGENIDDIKAIANLVGKRVYNKEDGDTITLAIE